MADVTRCPVCGEECYAPGVAQAILDATRTLRAENERLREALERIANTQPMYGGVPSYFMRIAREALEATDEPG